jgi:5'(3')-deoxyribonucleotidase
MGEEKKVLYVDMDNVLVNFGSGVEKLAPEVLKEFEGRDRDDIPGVFALMDPMPGAIEAFHDLAGKFDIYILSTAPWNNPAAASDKVAWVKKHLPEVGHKRLILSHHKNLNAGDFLIDDRRTRGVEQFKGEHIHFGTPRFPDWAAVVKYLADKA